MTDEKNGVTKSSSNAEMSPQEDGTKVPLTADSPGEVVEVNLIRIPKILKECFFLS